MRLLDANVLLRWLLRDDKPQTDAVERFLRHALAAREELLVSDLAMAELVWVMEGQDINASIIVRLLRTALNDHRIEFENRERLLTALTLYEAHGVDFIDAYQAGLAQERDLEAVVSFDRDFDRLPVARVEPR